MNHLTFNGIPLSDVTDKELLTWIREKGKVKNRIRDETAELWSSFLRVYDDIDPPMTTRQMFYQVETLGLTPKTESGYDKVQRQLVKARRAGIIEYSWVADNTRWMRKPHTYNNLSDFLTQSQDSYRRSIWAQQNTYVEIWIEKDALAGVVSPITEKWDVPLMVTKGYTSESFAYTAAESIIDGNKPTYIYYFGDHDPSGANISVDLEKKLRGFLDNFDRPFTFTRVALNESDISRYNLPTRPTKKKDPRAKNWIGESVELDAMRADTLRGLVDSVIKNHINPAVYEQTLKIEALERDTLKNVRLAPHSGEVTS